eukprot:178173-Chlamydomonas_euryale.AAC.3
MPHGLGTHAHAAQSRYTCSCRTAQSPNAAASRACRRLPAATAHAEGGGAHIRVGKRAYGASCSQSSRNSVLRACVYAMACVWPVLQPQQLWQHACLWAGQEEAAVQGSLHPRKNPLERLPSNNSATQTSSTSKHVLP